MKITRAVKMYNEDSTCPWCGEEMTWCEVCGMYSSNCCEEFGTCECS